MYKCTCGRQCQEHFGPKLSIEELSTIIDREIQDELAACKHFALDDRIFDAIERLDLRHFGLCR